MTQSDAGVASLTPTKITPAELDAFSAAQVQGSFQQTSQMAAMGAFNGVRWTMWVSSAVTS